jgi:hypothetical protein
VHEIRTISIVALSVLADEFLNETIEAVYCCSFSFDTCSRYLGKGHDSVGISLHFFGFSFKFAEILQNW